MQQNKNILLYFIFFLLLQFFYLNTTWSFSTKNSAIYDNNGNLVSINGIAWIGFQDSNFLGGLWSVPFNSIGSQSGVIHLLTTPWLVPGSNIPSQSVGVSFKSIRLAIQPGIWHNVSSVQSSPFNFAVTDVTNKTAGNGPFCDWTKGSDSSGHCMASLSAPNLLTAVINQLNNQNMLVMLDFHHRPGLGDNFRDGTVVASDYSLQNYHDDVANFVSTAAPNVFGIDIFNEPHQLYWYQENTQTTPAQPAWINVIAAAASAVYDYNKNILLFVEAPGGTNANDPYDPVFSQSSSICIPNSTVIDNKANIGVANDPTHCPAANTEKVVYIGSNWGENFRSLLDTTQSANGVAKFNVTQFRSMLIQAIKANNFSSTDPNAIANWLLGPNNDGNGGHIVFAPHLYGSAVAGWQTDANDSKIRFLWNFGFLNNSGFPFVVGELGYDTVTGGEDFFLDSVAPWLINHNSASNLFFWTFNNADSPAGIRADDSGYALFAWKEKDLNGLFGSTPPVQQFGSLCATVPKPTGYNGTALPVIAATGPSIFAINLTAFDSPTCINNVLVGNYTLTGNSIVDAQGNTYNPTSTPSVTVAQNQTTNTTIAYAAQPTGVLQATVSGDSNCPIPAAQQFTVAYSGPVNHQLNLTGTTPVSVTLPLGTYTISVTPVTLPNNPSCQVKFNNNVTITANTTVQENIQYVYVTPVTCAITAQCQTWGTPQDSWSGSSCNFVITQPNGLTNPSVITMKTSGISALTYVWNANASLALGQVTAQLTDAVYVPSFGWNANGIITLPLSATLTTNGKQYNCTVSH